MAKLKFTRATSLDGLAASKLHERELKRAHKLFKRGDIIPESLWLVANSMLAEKARTMAWDSKRPYAECQREVLQREPHLRLGCTAYMSDKEFSGIEFVTAEDETNDDAT